MNLVIYRQTVGTDGRWDAPIRKVEDRWEMVQNLHKMPCDKVRGYVMAIQKMKRFIDGLRKFDKPVWKSIIQSHKTPDGMVYTMTCTRIERR